MIVIVGRFSKQTILVPTTKIYGTVKIFHRLWERIFGIPETITSDRDKIFRSKKWSEPVIGIGSSQILSTAQTERKIQEIQAYLRNYLREPVRKKRNRYFDYETSAQSTPGNIKISRGGSLEGSTGTKDTTTKACEKEYGIRAKEFEKDTSVLRGATG
jgi:hypothetical protein